MDNGFKTCPNCMTYSNCPANRALQNYIKYMLLTPEVKHEKIVTAAAFLAEACPEYFTQHDAEK